MAAGGHDFMELTAGPNLTHDDADLYTQAETSLTDPSDDPLMQDPGETDEAFSIRKAADHRLALAVGAYYDDLKKMKVTLAGAEASHRAFTLGKDDQLYMGIKRLTSAGRPMSTKQYPGYLKVQLGLMTQLTKDTAARVQKAAKKGDIDLKRDIEALLADPSALQELEKRGYGQAIRELRGALKSMDLIAGAKAGIAARMNDTNEQYNGKVGKIDSEIERRRNKALEAPNEDARQIQEGKIKELEETRAKLNAERDAKIADLAAQLSGQEAHQKSQLARLRDCLYRLIHDDAPLGERIRTLFRVEGITIVSILTALSMVVAFIVDAVVGPAGAGGATPPQPPSDKGGIKDWVKKRLQDLGRLLGKLSEKAAESLPGIIGSIVSWLLSTAQKAVGWLAENLWALVVGVAGMVYLTARDYMMTSALSSKPKKH